MVQGEALFTWSIDRRTGANRTIELLVLLLMPLLGWASARGAINVERIIVIASALLVFGILIARREDAEWFLLCIGIASTILGHRGIYIGDWTYLVPLQIILWLIWALILVHDALQVHDFDLYVPLALALTLAWAVSHGIVAVAKGVSWDAVLAWVSPLALGFPAFAVTRRLIRNRPHVMLTLQIMLAVSAGISALGLLEYFLPQVVYLFPWFFKARLESTREGFTRAMFNFWGYPAAATFVGWGMIIAYCDWLWHRDAVRRAIDVVVFALGAAAVYVSGQRATWFSLPAALFVVSITNGLSGDIALMGLGAVTAGLPAVFWRRVATVTDVLRYGTIDSGDFAGRLERWRWAWLAMCQSPAVGVGYGQWLAHNIFLEIGSKIGVIPALAFGVFVAQLVCRIGRVTVKGSTESERQLGMLFLALAILWVAQMSVETVLHTPPFAAPHWVFMAIGWYLPEVLDREATGPDSPRGIL